ncbi:angiopoietin-related protein 7-like [Musca vetustissima]|uniref:angiopoietin-related protein 7-like n=1 Tax=Musca vetustissima TaxID=27455 RepID=UPI002AB6B866|nr:angiopoietin-related protein 7-like [Musca vetustissima]
MLYFILVLGLSVLAVDAVPPCGSRTLWEPQDGIVNSNPEQEIVQLRNQFVQRHWELMTLNLRKKLTIFEQKLVKLENELGLPSEISAVEKINSTAKSDDGVLSENEPEQPLPDNRKPAAEKIYFTDIMDDDEPKVCKLNNDSNLVCTNLSLAESCADSNSFNCRNGLCRIRNHIYGPKSFWVPCDGDWTIIQRRINGSVDFKRSWMEYRTGFGDLNGEFWLGLDKIHSLTTLHGNAELKIEMQDFDNDWGYARYESFSVGNENSKYRIYVTDYIESSAGDSLDMHDQKKFSNFDQDNEENCAYSMMGAWWYYYCRTEYVKRVN